MKFSVLQKPSLPAPTAPAQTETVEVVIPEAPGLSRRDAVRYLTGASMVGVAVSVLTGCGSGSGVTAGSVTTGRATIVITWPARTTDSKLIPVAANSIVATFSTGSTVLVTQTVARPTTGTTSTVTFAALPPGQLTLTATAYPNTDGTGEAQATATTTVTIVAGRNTAAGVTMASTINHLTISPSSPSVAVGATVALAATAVDGSGNTVLVSSSTISWASSATTIATVTSAGVVTGVAAGTATMTVTESESGKTATVTVTVGNSSTSHAVTPEAGIESYYTDDSASGYNRSNIVSNLDGTDTQAGLPLTLSIYVYDTENSDAALSGCQVDIWHCNAAGVFSNLSSQSTLGQSWLRGYQVTDTNGYVQFVTIVPGWYSGRTTHIYLRVRSKYSEASSATDSSNTTQLFFPQTTINYLATSVAPYKSEGANPTTNATDPVYTPQTLGETEMTLTGNYTNGFTSTVAIYLPITAE